MRTLGFVVGVLIAAGIVVFSYVNRELLLKPTPDYRDSYAPAQTASTTPSPEAAQRDRPDSSGTTESARLFPTPDTTPTPAEQGQAPKPDSAMATGLNPTSGSEHAPVAPQRPQSPASPPSAPFAKTDTVALPEAATDTDRGNTQGTAQSDSERPVDSPTSPSAGHTLGFFDAHPGAPETALPRTKVGTEAAEPVHWQPFWGPFNTRSSAAGFAKNISAMTGVEIRPVERERGDYMVAFHYRSEDERASIEAEIEQRTGLTLRQHE